MKITLPFKRIDTSLPVPEYHTPGAVAFDLYARETVTIAPGALQLIPNNLIVNIPDGYGMIIASRSSTPKRFQVIPPHGLAIIDRDYCGPEDELKTLVYNISDQPITIERGERISQAMLIPLPIVELEEHPLDSLFRTGSRGGFGSTS